MSGTLSQAGAIPNRVVDVHAHVVTGEFLRALHRLAPDVGPELIDDGDTVSLAFADHVLGPFPLSFVDPAARVAAMGQGGISLHVLSSPPFMFLYDLEAEPAAEACAAFNDSTIQWAYDEPGKFRVLASLPMQDLDSALRELERVRKMTAVAGIAIGSNINGKTLDQPEFEPVFAAMASADLPLLIHPNNSGDHRLSGYFLRNLVGNPVDTTVAGASLIFGGVLERLPDLRVCLVHGGGFVPYQLGRLVHGFERIPESRQKLTRSPRELLDQLFFDTIVHDWRVLRFMGEQVGWRQVVTGSDFPFDMGDLDLRATLQSLNLTQDVLDDVASRNAMRFLRGGVGG